MVSHNILPTSLENSKFLLLNKMYFQTIYLLTEDQPQPYFCSGLTIFLQRKAHAEGELKTS